MNAKAKPQTQMKAGPNLYHPKMARCLIVLRMVMALAVIAICSAGVSHTSPSGGEATEQCSFVLTPPKVVQVSGVSQVLVTMHPGPCTIRAVPNSQVVCLSIAGDGSPGHCASVNGQNPVLSYYAYRPGATYVVKAQGCVNTITPPYTLCQNFGPSQTTL